jgi:hypothetical protein
VGGARRIAAASERRSVDASMGPSADRRTGSAAPDGVRIVLVLQAQSGFFWFTKRLHAQLHGQDVTPAGPDERQLYEEVSRDAERSTR